LLSNDHTILTVILLSVCIGTWGIYLEDG